MVSLQLTKADGGLTEDQTRELDELQDAEARRYQLREQLLSKMSAKKQKELGWVEPIADGAVGIMPYTYMTSWSMLPKDMRKAARWYFDNVLLRWQGAVMGQYQPRAPRLTWYKKQKQKGVEQLFDDIDEEIYFDKKWQEQVKKGTARLDDLEEELTGYDRFTVEEEEKIKKLVDQYIASEISRIQDEDLST
jgi:hypothetical protein